MPVRTGSREHPWAEVEVVGCDNQGCSSSRVRQLLRGGQLQKLFPVLHALIWRAVNSGARTCVLKIHGIRDKVCESRQRVQ